jgi:hypothetical protein
MEKKKKPQVSLFQRLRKWIFLVIVVLVLIRLNKDFFFLGLFTFLAFAGKIVRSQFGLRMVVLDPLLFCSILIVKFMGIPALLIYLFINVFVADLVSGIFSPGSFLNYVLYHVAPIGGVLILGNLGMMVYGNVASLIYSGAYAFFRTTVLPDDPVAVTAKAITSFVFTFLYITFFGPIFQILMA